MLQSMGSQRVRQDLMSEQQNANSAKLKMIASKYFITITLKILKSYQYNFKDFQVLKIIKYKVRKIN